MTELPHWEPRTVTVLSTQGPHAIPVSTAVRTGPRTIALALATRRETLKRLEQDPVCALTIITGPDIAITAHCHARIRPLDVDAPVVAVELDVHTIQDHLQPTTSIHEGVAWSWTDDDARERDAAVRAALEEL